MGGIHWSLKLEVGLTWFLLGIEIDEGMSIVAGKLGTRWANRFSK